MTTEQVNAKESQQVVLQVLEHMEKEQERMGKRKENMGQSEAPFSLKKVENNRSSGTPWRTVV